jgi:hypothetical protein
MATLENGHELFWNFTTTEAVAVWVAISTVVIAVAAALIARQQILDARAAGRKADAQDSFRSYLEICLNNPDLASGNYGDYTAIKQDAELLERYEWFVAYLLAASEKNSCG